MGNPNQSIGDNKEFGVATLSDVTVYFYNSSGYTSTDDTATAKYFSKSVPRHQIAIRPDQAIQIVSINDQIFTDPITVFSGTTYSEQEGHDTWNWDKIHKIVIRTTVVNTNIKIRARGA